MTEEKPPTLKSTLASAASGTRVMMVSVTALRQAVTATPPRTTVVREALLFRATITTRKVAAIAPAKAAPATAQAA